MSASECAWNYNSSVKRFFLREFLLLCAPIALMGAGFVILQIRHPPRDPDSVIARNVTNGFNSANLATPLAPELSFG